MARKSQARKSPAPKTRKSSQFDQQFLFEQINEAAKREGPRIKKWTTHDLKNIKPKAGSNSQYEMFKTFLEEPTTHIVANGFPGTGKTYVSLWLALNGILNPEAPQDHIIIVRSAVPARDIGFLPGTQEEKMAPFEVAYKDIIHDLIGRPTSYEDMVEAGKIKFMPTSFLRGLTWDNAIVVVDEIQNMSWQEIHTIMTRVGKNTRLLVCGDKSQNDLADKRSEDSGFDSFLRVANNMKNFEVITFTKEEIVRSGFVKEWIIAKEDLGL
ncbi:phosphate starvation-inducible protein [Xanthomonas phage Xoo-sp13]|nr:phosphate starvation-inducible protein [Xanthomonas phage Xoo-sp13]